MTYPPYRPIVGAHPEHEKWETTAANFIGDLDRCEHGRHAVDDCYGCEGMSRGNPRARGEDPRLPDGRSILGYSLGGARRPWVLCSPQPTRREDPPLLVELVTVDDD
jgi:hypothetical protein